MSWLKKNSSIVWKYFQKNTNAPNEALYTLCKKSYLRANGISNLLEHLKRKHMPRLERDKMFKQNEELNDINLPGNYYVIRTCQNVLMDLYIVYQRFPNFFFHGAPCCI